MLIYTPILEPKMSKQALNGVVPIKPNTGAFALRADIQYVLYMSESEQGFQIYGACLYSAIHTGFADGISIIIQ